MGVCLCFKISPSEFEHPFVFHRTYDAEEVLMAVGITLVKQFCMFCLSEMLQSLFSD